MIVTVKQQHFRNLRAAIASSLTFTLNIASALFLLVSNLVLKKCFCEARKNVLISLQKFFLFSRKSKFRTLDSHIL